MYKCSHTFLSHDNQCEYFSFLVCVILSLFGFFCMSSTWSSSMFIYVFDWFVLFYHMLIEKARKLFYLLSMEKINESVDRFLIKFQETMTFYQIERSWLENIKYSLLRRGERENKYNQSFSLSLVWLECWCAFVWRFPFRCVCVCVFMASIQTLK